MKKLLLIVFVPLMLGCAGRSVLDDFARDDPAMREIMNFDFRWGESKEELRVRMPWLSNSEIVPSSWRTIITGEGSLYVTYHTTSRGLFMVTHHITFYESRKNTLRQLDLAYAFYLEKLVDLYGDTYTHAVRTLKHSNTRVTELLWVQGDSIIASLALYTEDDRYENLLIQFYSPRDRLLVGIERYLRYVQ
jgi:hypothetical protein